MTLRMDTGRERKLALPKEPIVSVGEALHDSAKAAARPQNTMGNPAEPLKEASRKAAPEVSKEITESD